MDRDLVERAMSGDHGAFTELARVAVGRLLVIARLILHDEAAAEDATQEALVAAWRNIRGLRDPQRFDAWSTPVIARLGAADRGADVRSTSQRWTAPSPMTPAWCSTAINWTAASANST